MSPRAVVIGAGLGGLAAAIRLRALGCRVLVLEALPEPGGRARVFRTAGFTFDAGPTVITAPYLIGELFRLMGREPSRYYRLVPVDPFYRIILPDGDTFDFVGDEERLLRQIERLEPRDVDGYRRLARHAERIFEVGYLKLAHRPFHRRRDMLRQLPRLLRLGGHRSVYSLVSRHIRDERLRSILSFESLLVGGDPFRTSAIYLLIHTLERRWGVHFAMGGTGALVQAMVELLEEDGVEVRCGSPVAEIEVTDGRVAGVRTDAGDCIPCDLVVANADPSIVYTQLVAARHRRRETDRAVARRSSSMGLFVGYFGTRGVHPELAHHTVLLGTRYRELLRDIFVRKVLSDDVALYLHAPSRTDPTLAPPGHEAFYVLAPVPNNRSGIDWTARGDAYFDRVLARLEETLLPGLQGRLVTRFHVTPNYFEDSLRSRDGSAFGIEPLLRQSAYFRFHNRSPDVRGLYLVGAGTHPGAGVPGVLSSAKVVEALVREDLVLGPAGALA